MTAIDLASVPTWGPLTAELKNVQSPVTLFIGERFPYVKSVYQRYRESVGPLVIDTKGANPSTIGTAFDWAVRFLVHPQPSLQLAFLGAGGPRFFPAATELAEVLGVRGGASRFAGLAAESTVDEETLLRGCWALALLTERFRVGPMPGSPLANLRPGQANAADLLALATQPALDELKQLRDLARTALLPSLAARSGQWALGPTFEGSRLMNADADLVVGGLLLELKTGLGDKRSDGSRKMYLERLAIQQVLGYVLLDFVDEFTIQEVGVYAARYGNLTAWRLPELLEELSGRPVDLQAERASFKDLLQAKAPRAAVRSAPSRHSS